MKKKKTILVSAFAIALTLTLTLSVYTRATADDPEPCTRDKDPQSQSTPSETVSNYVDCPYCQNVGDPYTEVIDGVTYTVQNVVKIHDMVGLSECTWDEFDSCTATEANPEYVEPECETIYTPGSGTN